MPQHANRLIHERSPYLLQHAHNPVDWYPWGDEAFSRAASEDKPVFLSIGYSTCHWCHVMERESFEREEVARLLNSDFVAVKVDREERPDVDEVYMAVCQAMTGSGGWPLTIVMTPDKRPFFAATYIPRESALGQMGMLELLPRITAFWREQRHDALDLAARVERALRQTPTARHPGELDEESLRQAYQELLARYDAARGGFGKAPKFPMPHNLSFLVRCWRRFQEPQALHMVEHTLQAMHRGGIWDQLGFGVHRYSTDRLWLVPHFEKMLYDQALTVLACLDAYQATHDPQYADMAREVLTYVRRDLTASEGGFYSAEDADSEGVEGKFYVWGHSQIEESLPKELAEVVTEAAGVLPQGNYHDEATGGETGMNILHLRQPLDRVAETLHVPPATVAERWEQARQLLLARRSLRVRPALDDKVLADWNGLMIAACARAGFVLDVPAYLDAATRAANFICGSMKDEQGRLLHRYRDGDAAIPGFLDDYAFMAWGLLELYQATFDPAHLRNARDFADHVLADFADGPDGAFYSTAAYHDELLVQRQPVYDGAIPSGNSVMLLNLLRLGKLLGQPRYEARARSLVEACSAEVNGGLSAHTQFLIGLDLALAAGEEIVIAGAAGQERQALLAPVREMFLPHAAVVLLSPAVREPLVELAPWLKEYPPEVQPAVAYVCRGHTCSAPLTDPDELRTQFSKDEMGPL